METDFVRRQGSILKGVALHTAMDFRAEVNDL